MLAHAGLLNGLRATTHWADLPDLKAQVPKLRTEGDVLYIDEGNIITSAGGASGIDACLHLVRRDFGTRIANAVARRMVIPPHSVASLAFPARLIVTGSGWSDRMRAGCETT